MGREYLADKPTLDEVNSKVGASSDAESGTSLFAKINSLLSTLANHVAAWTSTRAAKIDTIDTNAAKLSNTTYGLEALKGYVDEVENLLKNGTYGLSALKVAAGGSVIKSVQRGIMTFEKDSTSVSTTIKSVDINKAFVIYTGAYNEQDSNSYYYDSILTLDNATTITAKRADTGNYPGVKVPYQVIEFA